MSCKVFLPNSEGVMDGPDLRLVRVLIYYEKPYVVPRGYDVVRGPH